MEIENRADDFYFRRMKRFFLLLVLLMVGFTSVHAQDATAADAAKAETDEKLKRISGDMEMLTASLAKIQKDLSAMSDRMDKIQEEQTRLANTSSSQDAIKSLAQKIQEVDKKRADDKDLIAEQIKQLGKILAANAGGGTTASVSPTTHTKPKTTPKVTPEDPSTTAPTTPQKGYEYEVQSGDSLSKIVELYNVEFKSKGMKTITLSQVLSANPGLKPEKLYIGKKVFIPMPGQ